MLDMTTVLCPYCGEHTDIEVDISAGSQQYIEDCQICCRPIEFQIAVQDDGMNFQVNVKRDDE